MDKIAVIVLDDHRLIREALVYIIRRDKRLEVIGDCKNVQETVTTAKIKKPDVILLSINMPFVNGYQTVRHLKRELTNVSIVCISENSQSAYVKKIISLGVKGYVSKYSSSEEVTTAIIKVHQRDTYICSETKNFISEQILTDNKRPELTERQALITQLMRDGFSSEEIAKKINVATKTVEVHRSKILRKFKVKNTLALVNHLNKWGEL